jgi:porin
MNRYSYFFLGGCLAIGQMLAAQNEVPKKESPFEFGASYVGEWVSVLNGGLKRGSVYQGLANIRMSFDTQKAGWWKGGTFLVTGADTHGGNPSADLVGDFQVISNMEADNLTYLHELWYRQDLGKLSLIVGLQDLNAEFVSTENGGLFLNSSFGTHSTISSNVPSPIFPLTSLGAFVQYVFTEKATAKFAVFDGMPEDLDYNPHNISWNLDSDGGYLAFAELDVATVLTEKYPGMYKIGAYYHNHNEIGSSADPTDLDEDHGFYLTADQNLYNTVGGKSLDAFVQLSISPKFQNDNYCYLGAGMNYTGLLSRKKNDVLGLAVAHARLQNSVNGNETTLELTWRVRFCDALFVQPDFQYVIHPAGTEEPLKNALAGILRFGFEF